MNNCKILARICGVLERKRVKVCTLLGAFLMSLSLFTVLKPSMDPFSLSNLQSSRALNMVSIIDTKIEVTSTSQQIGEKSTKPKAFELPICNFSGKKSDFCEINGDIRIHGNSSSIFFTSPQLSTIPKNTTLGIKLYARKPDNYLKKILKEQRLISASTEEEMPKCSVNHTIPAIVFHAGAYSGNYFHTISDIMVPLYLTSLRFNKEVQFLIEGERIGWVKKHETFLKALSNYEPIDLDFDTQIRCFKNAVVGLKSHDDFLLDPHMSPYGYTLRNFTRFVRETYALERETTLTIKLKERKPRLLLLARNKTRSFLNKDDIVAEAKGLGFDVKIFDAGINLKDFSKMVNSFDVMVGVHGAGLTNMIFLPENAVLIQVIPLGLDSMSQVFYERPARNMNLKYLQYKICKKESSLLEQYPIDHPVIVEPQLFMKQGWQKFKSIYLESQDVRVDVSKFKVVLLEALELLRQ